MINNLIKWSLNNRLLVIILGLVLFVFGSFYTYQSPVDVLPEFAPPQVVIQTEAPGLAPEEVEALVTIPIESAVNGTNRVQTVRSSSIEGLSFVTVIFDFGTDIYTARQLITEKVQSVASLLPKSVKTPTLSPITSPIGPVYYFALTAKNTPLMDLRSFADWEIRNKILAIPGIARVLTYGGDLKQYQILIDLYKLTKYSLGLNQIVEAAENANIIVGGGYLIQEDREYLIRGLGRINSITELEDSVITTNNEAPIFLKDVARIQIGSALKKSYGSVDGKEAVIIAISRQPGVNTLEVTKKITAAIQNIKKSLPKDVEIIPTYNQADFINVSIKNIISAIIEGSILVIIILVLFLGNWRTSVISLTAIPISIIIAIVVLRSFDQTINAMTLGGLAIAIGEIVDDAIIDVENVYKRLKENKISDNPRPVLDVIFDASIEVRSSVVYGTCIITIVFAPVLFLGGLAGQIFKPLGLAYIISIFASLFAALTLTPAMCFYLLSKDIDLKDHEPKILTKLKEKYTKALDYVLHKPKKLFISSIILFLIAVILFFNLGKAFLPELGEENLIIMAFNPPGSSLKATQNVALAIEKKLKKYPEVIRVGNRAGRSENDDEPITSNISHFDITLKPGIEKHKKEKLMEAIAEDFEDVPGMIALIRSFISEAIEQVSTGQRAPIVFKLYGNDLRILKEYAEKIAKILKQVPGLTEVQLEPISDIPQIHIEIKRNVAARYGLTVGDLSKTIHVAFNGISTEQKVIEGQKAFDIYVWFDKEFRNDLEAIKNTLIDTPTGVKIPLGQVAEVREKVGPNIINRENVSRRMVILANAKKADMSKSVEKGLKLIEQKITLPEGYLIDVEGDYKQQKETNQKLIVLGFLILIAIFLILAFAFKSFKIATIIMANLPLALIGGVLAIALSGEVISIASMIGFITLFGLSTRNSILLVHRFVDIEKEQPELNIDEVIKHAALDRLAPILMTALTAAFAMLPLALFPGAGREIEHPLAIVILGGLFSATALTLLALPVAYKYWGR